MKKRITIAFFCTVIASLTFARFVGIPRLNAQGGITMTPAFVQALDPSLNSACNPGNIVYSLASFRLFVCAPTSVTGTNANQQYTAGAQSYTCGTAALAANGACVLTTGTAAKVVTGNATLSGSTSTITALPFTATNTYYCTGNDVTTRANPVQVVPASASTATITNTTGATDVISFTCVGY